VLKSRPIQAVVLSVALLVASAGLRAQTTPAQNLPVLPTFDAGKPLTKAQVDDLIASGLDSERIAKAVQERGVDFDPTDQYLETVRSRGGKQVLLDALRAANSIPLSKSELLRLLTAGKSSESLQAMVERRGINFKATDEDLDTLRIGGATEGLIKAVRDAREISSAGGGVSAPIPIYSPDPPYSEEARRAKLSGTVVVQIIVDSAGNVRDAKVTRPLGLGLDEKAVETIRTWRFKPAMRDGVPVNVRMLVQVAFRIFTSPPPCPLPFVFAEMDWYDPHKVTWDQFAGDVVYWWTRQGGSAKFPKICQASRWDAGYTIVWRRGVATIRVEVYRLVRGEVQYPPVFLAKDTSSSKGAFKQAAKYLAQQEAPTK